MVLVLAVAFLTAANAAPALLAQTARGTAAARRHTAWKATPHKAAHKSTRGTAQSSGCPAARPSARKHHAAAATGAGRPERRPRSRNAVVPKTRRGRASASQNAVSQPATPPVVRPASFSLRHMVMLPPMRGSMASLERQNQKAEAEGLERIEDENDLTDRIARGILVPVPASSVLVVNSDLAEHHRYCRPWTARFLTDLASAYAAQFHGPLEVSSAVRTVAYQKHLMAVNGNAAAAEGDIVSPHLTGATIDIAKKGMTRQQIGWMRSWLTPLQDAGKIDVEEEFQQACFHITVYKEYAPKAPALPKPQQGNAAHSAGPPALGR